MNPHDVEVPSNSRLTITDIIKSHTPHRSRKNGQVRYFAVCSCSCGSEEFVARLDNITNGRTLSCGCALADANKQKQPLATQRAAEKKRLARMLVHQKKHYPLYEEWQEVMAQSDEEIDEYVKKHVKAAQAALRR